MIKQQKKTLSAVVGRSNQRTRTLSNHSGKVLASDVTQGN